jgi:integrase
MFVGDSMEKVSSVKDKEKENELISRLFEIHPKYRILWYVGSTTGLRVSDILDLRVKDIKKNITVIEKKTKKERTIKVSDTFIDEISQYATAFHLQPSDHLIPGRTRNKPLNRVQAWRVIKQAAAEVGLDGIGTHSMRKTFATDLFALSGDAAVVQKALNHKYIETTLSYLGKRMVFIDA